MAKPPPKSNVYQALIDDMEKNTRAWEKAGGLAILHRDFPTTGTLLEAITGLEVRHG